MMFDILFFKWLMPEGQEMPKNDEELLRILAMIKEIRIQEDLMQEQLDALQKCLEINQGLLRIIYDENVSAKTIADVNSVIKEANATRSVGNEIYPEQIIERSDLTNDDLDLLDLETIDNEKVMIRLDNGRTASLESYQQYLSQNEELQSEVADVNLTPEEQLMKMYDNAELKQSVDALQGNPFTDGATLASVYQQVGQAMDFDVNDLKNGELDPETAARFQTLSMEEQAKVLDCSRDYQELRNHINTVLDAPSENEYTNVNVTLDKETASFLTARVEKITPAGERGILIDKTLPYDKQVGEQFLEPLTSDFAMRSPVIYSESKDSAVLPMKSDVNVIASNNNSLVISNVDTAQADTLVQISQTVQATLYESQIDARQQVLSTGAQGAQKQLDTPKLMKRLEPPKGFTNTLFIVALVFILFLVCIFFIR